MSDDGREVFVPAPPDQQAEITANWLRSMFPTAMAVAEARGYRRAVERMRDSERYQAWEDEHNVGSAFLMADERALVADYLEATEPEHLRHHGGPDPDENTKAEE